MLLYLLAFCLGFTFVVDLVKRSVEGGKTDECSRLSAILFVVQVFVVTYFSSVGVYHAFVLKIFG
jgi:hypothetical protein